MADNSLVIRISAKSDEFSSEMKRLGGITKNLEKQLATVAKISGAAFIGLAGTVGYATKEFAKFDNGIRGVRTLLNETSFGTMKLEKGFEKMRKELLIIGKTMPVSIDALNKSIEGKRLCLHIKLEIANLGNSPAQDVFLDAKAYFVTRKPFRNLWLPIDKPKHFSFMSSQVDTGKDNKKNMRQTLIH